MDQIGALLAVLPLVKALWKYLVVIAALVALYLFVHSKLVDWADARAAPKIAAAQAETRAARAELTKLVEETRARAAQLTLDWQSARDRADQAEKELASERAKKFVGLVDRVRAGSGAVGSVRLPAPLVGGLHDGIAAANSSLPAPAPGQPGEDPQATSTVADLAESAVTCYAYYADAVDQILGLQRFYHDLQRTTNAPSS